MKKIFAFVLVLLSLSLFVSPAQAQIKSGVFDRFNVATFGKTYDTSQGKDLESSLPAAVGQVISVFLGLIGVIMLIIMVYAGFLWLTAGGNDEQVKKAKNWIKNAVIGAIIALGAFIVTSFVVRQLQTAISESGTTTPPAGKASGTG